MGTLALIKITSPYYSFDLLRNSSMEICMKKKKLLWLILFANIMIATVFLTTELLIHQKSKTDTGTDPVQLTKQDNSKGIAADTDNGGKAKKDDSDTYAYHAAPTKEADDSVIIEEATAGFASDATNKSFEETENTNPPLLITDSREVDYQAYIPKMQKDSELETVLNIDNPKIGISAESAILFDADTKKVLYYKDPVHAVFPASTLKLLTSLVALSLCSVDEKVTIGDEIKMIASDSTRAYLKEGEVLSLYNLLEGMLLPSGNDAAYAVATYVGRKSLNNPQASKEEAVVEFVRLMNEKARELGVKNSCFKTPDGYDAVGQYTTAYDMGLIAIEAASNDTIVEIAGKSSARVTFDSGQDVTWKNTNKLINRYSGEYYEKAIGLKTGTSTMAGRCLLAAAKSNGRRVVCAILDSSPVGRWEDAIALLKYGLK